MECPICNFGMEVIKKTPEVTGVRVHYACATPYCTGQGLMDFWDNLRNPDLIKRFSEIVGEWRQV